MSEHRLRRLATPALTAADVSAVRELLDAAFADDGEGFAETDWEHAVGGRHYLLDLDGSIVSHAAVVVRVLEVGGRSLRTGYVEAVATAPPMQGRGYGTIVMEAASADIRAAFELGALSTARPAFYERLGWQSWLGPSLVRTTDGPVSTLDDDGALMVLTTPGTPVDPALDRSASISCDWRSGDVW